MADALSLLAEASFEGVPFPLSDLSVEGGNDFAEHTAYLRRGADMEPCGQKAYRGSFTIPLVNTPRLVARYGDLFTDLRAVIVAAFEETPIGSLTLPGYGTFPAAITGWTGDLAPDVRSGVPLKVTFVEHNGEASLLETSTGATPANTPATVTIRAGAADAAMIAYPGATAALAVASVVTAQLAALDALGVGAPLTATGECFRRMLDPIGARLVLPLFAPASANGVVLALLALQAAVLDLQSRYQPTLSLLRRYTVPETMALWQIALSVYGDASQTALLRAANSISDPLFVPSGTVLTILPAA